MPTNHPAVTAFPISAAANQTNARNMAVQSHPLVVASAAAAADLVAVDPTTGAVVKTLILNGAIYVYDSTDTTSEHDGITVLVSSDGKRYRLDEFSVAYRPIRWIGTYSGATTYSVGHGVSYLGASYVSIANSNINHTPPNASWWQVLAQPGIMDITDDTANRILALTDAGDLVTMEHGSARTITVPPNSSVAFPLKTIIYLWRKGAGAVDVAAGVGVTIRTPAALTLRAQYSMASLIKIDTDTWILNGDLTSL